tara:strand:- start:124 stop:315 length:192 start_codon:yes stop_codon:yes gene_type:complete
MPIFFQKHKNIQRRPLQENNFSSLVPLRIVLKLSFDNLKADVKQLKHEIEHKNMIGKKKPIRN